MMGEILTGSITMFGLGTGELIILLVLVVLLFGAKRIPQLGESLGKSIRSFKKGLNTPIEDQTDENPKQTQKED